MMKRIRLEAVYPHDIEDVWEAVATSEGLAAWLMPNDFTPVKGREFSFKMESATGFDGTIACRVLECSPPRHLSFSWCAGDAASVVTITLTPLGKATTLTLEHEGFENESGVAMYEILKGGWTKKLLGGILAGYLAERAS